MVRDHNYLEMYPCFKFNVNYIQNKNIYNQLFPIAITRYEVRGLFLQKSYDNMSSNYSAGNNPWVL